MVLQMVEPTWMIEVRWLTFKSEYSSFVCHLDSKTAPSSSPEFISLAPIHEYE